MISCAHEQMRYLEITVRNCTAHFFIFNKTGIVVLQYPPNGQLVTWFNNHLYFDAKSVLKHYGTSFRHESERTFLKNKSWQQLEAAWSLDRFSHSYVNTVFELGAMYQRENTTLVKFVWPYIRDPRNVFSISPLARILMTLYLAFVPTVSLSIATRWLESNEFSIFFFLTSPCCILYLSWDISVIRAWRKFIPPLPVVLYDLISPDFIVQSNILVFLYKLLKPIKLSILF